MPLRVRVGFVPDSCRVYRLRGADEDGVIALEAAQGDNKIIKNAEAELASALDPTGWPVA